MITGAPSNSDDAPAHFVPAARLPAYVSLDVQDSTVGLAAGRDRCRDGYCHLARHLGRSDGERYGAATRRDRHRTWQVGEERWLVRAKVDRKATRRCWQVERDGAGAIRAAQN